MKIAFHGALGAVKSSMRPINPDNGALKDETGLDASTVYVALISHVDIDIHSSIATIKPLFETDLQESKDRFRSILEQAPLALFYNLIINSLKFSREGEPVTIGISPTFVDVKKDRTKAP
jgi:signal transduction histidine kinase